MVVECVAILTVLMAVIFVFLRSHKKSYVLATSPLLFVPAAFLLATLFSRNLTGMTLGVFRITGVLVGLVCACLMLGMLSVRMKSAKKRYIYLITTGTFLLLITWCLVYRVMEPLF